MNPLFVRHVAKIHHLAVHYSTSVRTFAVFPDSRLTDRREPMNASNSPAYKEVAHLEDLAMQAMQNGHQEEAFAAWSRIINVHAQHPHAHTQVGQYHFTKGDFLAARVAFQNAADLDSKSPRPWVNLALVYRQLGDDTAEEQAIFKALTADPYDLLALIMRGRLFERQGRSHAASSAYGAAATVAPPLEQLGTELRDAVIYAKQFHNQYQLAMGQFIDNYLADHVRGQSQNHLDRFQLSLDILLGRKRRYDSQPMQLFVPGLAPIEFFDRKLFPWMDALEADTEIIRNEFLAVLASDKPDFVPYLTYAADQPLAQWAELNQSVQWTAFHLVKEGAPVPENAAQCPKTMESWSKIPTPEQPGRTPVAMFSLLKPKTRIPPHVGVSNARLVAHLPLVVPPGCGFRVGNSVREWAPGRAWVFDDTIEHEAWNNSNDLRAILIFDVWHPGLNEDEQRMIGLLSSAMNAFNSESATGYTT